MRSISSGVRIMARQVSKARHVSRTLLRSDGKYLSRLLPDFKEVGALIDPKRPHTYSGISQLIAMYDSYLVRVEPESSLEYITEIYPLQIDLRIISMC